MQAGAFAGTGLAYPVPCIVIIEAGEHVGEAAPDVFLNHELGTARDHCQIIRLVRFSGNAPPRIVRNQLYGGRP